MSSPINSNRLTASALPEVTASAPPLESMSSTSETPSFVSDSIKANQYGNQFPNTPLGNRTVRDDGLPSYDAANSRNPQAISQDAPEQSPSYSGHSYAKNSSVCDPNIIKINKKAQADITINSIEEFYTFNPAKAVGIEKILLKSSKGVNFNDEATYQKFADIYRHNPEILLEIDADAILPIADLDTWLKQRKDVRAGKHKGYSNNMAFKATHITGNLILEFGSKDTILTLPGWFKIANISCDGVVIFQKVLSNSSMVDILNLFAPDTIIENEWLGTHTAEDLKSFFEKIEMTRCITPIASVPFEMAFSEIATALALMKLNGADKAEFIIALVLCFKMFENCLINLASIFKAGQSTLTIFPSQKLANNFKSSREIDKIIPNSGCFGGGSKQRFKELMRKPVEKMRALSEKSLDIAKAYRYSEGSDVIKALTTVMSHFENSEKALYMLVDENIKTFTKQLKK